jgi:hypothetical protein
MLEIVILYKYIVIHDSINYKCLNYIIMVSILERTIWYTGLIGIYAYGGYMYILSRSAFDQKYHDWYCEQAEKFVANKPNLRFIDTRTKLLFLFGVDSNTVETKHYALVDKLLEDFLPGYFIYERNFKQYI